MNYTKYILIFSIFIFSCSLDKSSDNLVKSPSGTEKTDKTVDIQDSIIIWVSSDFSNAIREDISICDCWSKTKYHFLYFDTTELELFLQSNLMYFGHDSELILPLRKSGVKLIYDSLQNDWPVEPKSFELPTNDTLTLLEGDRTFKFIRKVYKYSKDTTNKSIYTYSLLNDIFYQMNSRLLLKYDVLDTAESTHELISVNKLKELINSNKVDAHCSDDYGLDGITIKENKNRYFQLVFDRGKVVLFEHNGRNRYEKLNLDSLPKQVLKSN